jgi:hypothetical protein
MNAANSSISALQSSSSSGSGVPTSRLINTAAPLAGGGSLASDLSLSISPGSNGDVLSTVGGSVVWAAGGSGVPTTRTITTTAPLRIDGGASADLSANRTLSISTNGIAAALFRQSAALSVVGNPTGSTANVVDISSATTGEVLVNTGGALGFSSLATLVAGLTRGLFGDGYDGALNFDGVTSVTLGDGTVITQAAGVYNLPRDIVATTVNIATGVVIEGKGFFIFATVSITGAGTAVLRCNGGNGSNGGAALGGGGGTAAVASAGRYNALTAAGVSGGNSTGGSPGTATLQVNPQKSTSASGVLSGGAGGNGSGGVGGNAGLAVAGGVGQGTYRTFSAIVSGRTSGGTNIGAFGGSSGGGGGGTTGGTGGGGGSGAAGGYVGIFTPQVLGTLLLQVKGGNGGNATAGNAGGGGAGSGGRIAYLVWAGATNLTFDISGGTGGSKTGTGVAGGNGGVGEIIAL